MQDEEEEEVESNVSSFDDIMESSNLGTTVSSSNDPMEASTLGTTMTNMAKEDPIIVEHPLVKDQQVLTLEKKLSSSPPSEFSAVLKKSDNSIRLKQASQRFKNSFKSSMSVVRNPKTSINLERSSQQFQDFLDKVKTKKDQVVLRTREIIKAKDDNETSSKDDKNSEDSKEEKVGPIYSPMSILNSNGCTAQTLTISDYHATILLTHNEFNSTNKIQNSSSFANSIENHTEGVRSKSINNDNKAEEKEDIDAFQGKETIQSILKLRLSPFHRIILGRSNISKSEEREMAQPDATSFDAETSSQIISFLQGHNFTLTTDSGEEYSFYNGNPSNIKVSSSAMTNIKDTFRNVQNSINNQVKNTDNEGTTVQSILKPGSFQVELIAPATERQISRCMPSPAMVLIQETPQLYEKITLPHIQSILKSDSLDWIQNILNGTKEKERRLLETPDFIIGIDTKWRSHPDPIATPKEQWLDHHSVSDLYCLGIVKDKSIRTLRDLRREKHAEMLASIEKEGIRIIQSVYGVKEDQIRIFVHYQPQFYHFHVHFTRLENESGCSVEKSHLISDILQNLDLDDDYYQKRTITYKLKKTDPLFNLLRLESMSNKI